MQLCIHGLALRVCLWLCLVLAVALGSGCSDSPPEPGHCPPASGNCDDANACTDDTCAPDKGCVHLNNQATCVDDNPCLAASVCLDGACHGSVPTDCDDDDVCTADSCDEATGCVHAAAPGPCDDGDPCTEDDGCAAGICEGGSQKSCPGVSTCATAACDSSDGECRAVPANEGVACAAGAGKCSAGGCSLAADKDHAMVFVPAGPFWMGCNPAKDDFCMGVPGENPQHEVQLPAFWIDRHEVTVAQYGACVSAGVCSEPQFASKLCNWGNAERGQHPINCVDWAQARAYCKWRGDAYDLPSEARWEKAARGGCEHHGGAQGCKAGMRTYPWGESAVTCELDIRSDATWGCGKASTWPVGSVPKGDSPYGVRDMTGNLLEWVVDWYQEDFNSKSPKIDPVNAVPGSFRVNRGGGWYYDAFEQRTTDRFVDDPDYFGIDVGFRCIKS